MKTDVLQLGGPRYVGCMLIKLQREFDNGVFSNAFLPSPDILGKDIENGGCDAIDVFPCKLAVPERVVVSTEVHNIQASTDIDWFIS